MEVTYKNSITDLEYFTKYTTKNTKYGKRHSKRVFISRLLLGLVLSLLFTFQDYWIYGCITFLIVIVFSWLNKNNVLWNATKKEINNPEYKYLWEPVTLSISENGLLSKRNGYNNSSEWKTIEKIFDDEKYIVILNSPIQGYIIPKNAFSSDEKAKDFVMYIHKHTTC